VKLELIQRRHQGQAQTIQTGVNGYLLTCRGSLLQGLGHVFNHFFGITKHHHGFVHVKQLIV